MRLVVLFTLVWFCSCVTPKKIDDYLDKHPDFTAKDCAERYPIAPDTLINYYWDTITVDRVIVGDSVYIIKHIKGEERVKILVKTVTITKENTAKIQALINKYEAKIKKDSTFYASSTQLCQQSATDRVKAEKKLRKYKAYCLKLLIAVILLLLWIFRKPILRLFSGV